MRYEFWSWWCILLAAQAIRVPKPEAEPKQPEPANSVNFSFMTNDRSYGRDSSLTRKVADLLWEPGHGARAKEEIVKGHVCQEKGKWKETYYASSFCYWIPELGASRASREASLTWQPEARVLGQDITREVVDGGKCVQTMACHNNGRDGKVTGTSFAQELMMKECLREKEILRICELGLEEASVDLKQNVTSCNEVERRYDAAVRSLKNCAELPGEIQELPKKIQDQEREVERKKSKVKDEERDEKRAQRQVIIACRGFDMVRAPICGFRLSDARKAADCIVCKRMHNKRKDAQRGVEYAKRKHRDAEKALRSLKSRLIEAKKELAQCEEKTPSLRATKEAMDEEWLPLKGACSAAHQEYKAKQESWIPDCTREKYVDSCEKKCLEIENAGCGVVEGDRFQAPQTPGVQLACSPPQASWIMGPLVEEPMEQQCERILRVQQPRFAQSILKAGFMWRKDGMRWKKHFAILESGDAVRSAVLRFYKDEPKEGIQTASAPDIVLWDAKAVKPKEPQHYGFQNGEECFKLYHFYQDYRFCAEGGGEWMKLIGSSLKFSDWTPEK